MFVLNPTLYHLGANGTYSLVRSYALQSPVELWSYFRVHKSFFLQEQASFQPISNEYCTCGA